MNCQLCNKELKNITGLSKHLYLCHKDITKEEYIIRFIHEGIRPTCLCGCGLPTKFNLGSGLYFSKFKKGHSNQEIKDKIERKRLATCLERYGKTCTIQTDIVKEKTRKTNLEKYGVENYSQSQECKDKIKQTCLKKYGVNSYLKSEKSINEKTKRKTLNYETIVKYCNLKQCSPLFDEQDYVHNRQTLKFKCNIHNIEFESKIVNVQRSHRFQCPSCKSMGISEAEKEIVQYVKSIYKGNIIENTKNIIAPQELDLFLPDLNIAIEHNGLFWHSELEKQRSYHYNKFLNCKEKGIFLIQIYEDEWRDKKEICKSIIKNKLGLSETIPARKLKMNINPDKNKVENFLQNFHLQGSCRSVKDFSLETNEGEIMMVLTLRKPFIKKEGSIIEIARVASRYSIQGGFSRLMKYVKQWCLENNYKIIFTYSDCRYSWGNVYQKYGFQFIGHTDVGYDYTDTENRFGRFKFRAKNGKSQKEIANENKIVKIYNAGNYKWQLNL